MKGRLAFYLGWWALQARAPGPTPPQLDGSGSAAPRQRVGALRYTAGVDGMSALPLVRILAQPARAADGSTLYPGERVVGLVVSHPAWARPTLLDGGSRAIVSGMPHYPRPGTNPTHLPCHKNLAVVAARAALGEQLARILGQGAAELLTPGLVGSTMASTVPTGAVPKVGKNSFRDIADGRDKRVSSTDWGTPLSPARGPAAEPPWWPPKHGPAANDGFRSSLRPMLGVVWVDDFVFHKRAHRHEACGGFAGGCLVCGLGAVDARRVFDGDPAGKPYWTPGEDGPERPVPVPRSRQTCPAPRRHSHPGGRPDTCGDPCDKPYCGV